MKEKTKMAPGKVLGGSAVAPATDNDTRRSTSSVADDGTRTRNDAAIEVASYVNPLKEAKTPFIMPSPLPRGLDYTTTHYVNAQNLKLHMHRWIPSEDTPRAIVVALHGLYTHIGYSYSSVDYTFSGSLIEALTRVGYGVVGIDHQSMGMSDAWSNKRGNVRRFTDLVRDISEVIRLVKTQFVGVDVYLSGVSFGGMMALRTVLASEPDLVRGVILCAPAIRLAPASCPSKVVRVAVSALGAVFPSMKLVAEPGDANDFWQKRYLTDPYCYTEAMRARFCAELFRSFEKLDKSIPALQLPFILFQGQRDEVVDPAAAKHLFERSGSTDKTVFYITNMAHAVTGEPGCQSVFRRIIAWLDARAANSTPIVQAAEETIVARTTEDGASGTATPTQLRASNAQLFKGAVRAIIFERRLRKSGWKGNLMASLR